MSVLNGLRSALPKVISAVLLCVVMVLSFLVLGEVYARLRNQKAALGGFTSAHPVFHHIPIQNYRDRMSSEGDFDVPFSTNNRGLRGARDYLYDKPKSVFRIAVLGDSFTFGVGVGDEEVFPVILEGLLNAGGSGPYEIENFGVPSYSPILEYIYLKNEVIKYDPDLVVLMLDQSDVYDDYHYQPHLVFDRKNEIVGCDPLLLRGKPDIWAYCKKYSRFLYMLDQKILQSVLKIRTIGPVNYFSNKLKGKRNKAEILTNKHIDNIYFDKFFMFRDDRDSKIAEPHWKRTSGYIGMIKEYLDARGVRLVLVTYPYGHQVSGKFWNKGRIYWGFEPDKLYDPKDGFSIIEDFAGSRGIDTINLYDGLQGRSDEGLYFDRDGHWTDAGHRAVADIIFNSNVFRQKLRLK